VFVLATVSENCLLLIKTNKQKPKPNPQTSGQVFISSTTCITGTVRKWLKDFCLGMQLNNTLKAGDTVLTSENKILQTQIRCAPRSKKYPVIRPDESLVAYCWTELATSKY